MEALSDKHKMEFICAKHYVGTNNWKSVQMVREQAFDKGSGVSHESHTKHEQ